VLIQRYIWPWTGLLLTALLYGCATAIDPSCPMVTPEPPRTLAKEPDPIVQVLQGRIHERDKQIADLKNKLEILKHIDLDVRTNKKLNPSPRKSAQ
jgi:hypothetical protein